MAHTAFLLLPQIEKVDLRDEGTYSCAATNTVGESRKHVVLKVLGEDWGGGAEPEWGLHCGDGVWPVWSPCCLVRLAMSVLDPNTLSSLGTYWDSVCMCDACSRISTCSCKVHACATLCACSCVVCAHVGCVSSVKSYAGHWAKLPNTLHHAQALLVSGSASQHRARPCQQSSFRKCLSDFRVPRFGRAPAG